MNLREEILGELSIAQYRKIVAYVGNDKKRFAELIGLFLGDEYRVTQRATWAITHCAEKYPALILPHLTKIVDRLEKDATAAVKRNIIRVFQWIEIPEKLQGRVAEICFRFLCSKDEAIAVKVFSMTVLHNLCKEHPDLKNELRIAIEEQMPYASAGFKSRGKKILKALTHH
ncbi:MAG: hypothetical protein POELPBGB_03349 [Bacteroidia bacterium]|nr:hypothetical protein [Bacteroidia bacterium]